MRIAFCRSVAPLWFPAGPQPRPSPAGPQPRALRSVPCRTATTDRMSDGMPDQMSEIECQVECQKECQDKDVIIIIKNTKTRK